MEEHEALKMFMEEVYEVLRERNIPIASFSEKIFGSSSELSRIKRGNSGVSVTKLEKIAEELDLKLIICLGESDE